MQASRANHFNSDRSLRIFCIDDSPTSRATVLMVLANRPEFAVHVAEDPAKGMAEIERAIAENEPYDVFVVDIVMQPMDGFEFLERVRELPHHRATPVVFLSGTTDAALLHRAHRAGAAVVVKSKIDVLRHQILEVVHWFADGIVPRTIT